MTVTNGILFSVVPAGLAAYLIYDYKRQTAAEKSITRQWTEVNNDPTQGNNCLAPTTAEIAGATVINIVSSIFPAIGQGTNLLGSSPSQTGLGQQTYGCPKQGRYIYTDYRSTTEFERKIFIGILLAIVFLIMLFVKW